MKRWVICFVLIAMTGLVRAEAPAAKASGALTPAPKVDKDGKPQKRFMEMHESFLKRGQEPADVLFLGDSITEGWVRGGKDIWEANYAKYKAANFGISGDRTQHVLWRIENGELDTIKPKVTVLMLGTNNLGADDADSIEKADEEIVKTIREKTGSKVLLLGVFPRTKKDDPKDFPAKIEAINKKLEAFADGTNVRYLDISKAFLEDDGSISKEVMADGLHPTKEGYVRWAKAMNPTLEEMLK
jgi:lysophospholipase L1-like esterase